MGQACCRADLPALGYCPSPAASSLPGDIPFAGVNMGADVPLEGPGLGRSGAQCLHLSLSLQFADGVYLVLLMGLLEGYFVPLHSFFLTPDSFEQKVRGGDITGGPSPHARPILPHLCWGHLGKRWRLPICPESSVVGWGAHCDAQLSWDAATYRPLSTLNSFPSPAPWSPSRMLLPGATAQPHLSPEVTGKVATRLVRPEASTQPISDASHRLPQPTRSTRGIWSQAETLLCLLNMSCCLILSTVGTYVPEFTVLAVTQEHSKTGRGFLTPLGVLHQQQAGPGSHSAWPAQFGSLICPSKNGLILAQPLPHWLQCWFLHFPGAGHREPQGSRNECAAPHALPFSLQVLNVSFAFELMQDGGLEKPKPRPEGTLLFPGLVTIWQDPPLHTSFQGTEQGSCLIPEGRLSFLKPSLPFAGEGGTGCRCSVLGILCELQIAQPQGK